jgi:hypothetical protein
MDSNIDSNASLLLHTASSSKATSTARSTNGLRLASKQAHALADVVQLLLCGEESAAMAFERLANAPSAELQFTCDLQTIARDELRHQSLLESLAQLLPRPTSDATSIAATRGFFRRIASRDRGVHLARIVALDSAVCLLIGELRRCRHGLAQEPTIMDVLSHIHGDEARHVVQARHYAAQLVSRETRHEVFAMTRLRLIHLVGLYAEAFECLSFDVDRVSKTLRRVPRTLVT